MFDRYRRFRGQKVAARPRLHLLPVLSVAFLLFSACATDKAHLRKEARQRETLAELVEGYWHALRWEYYDMAVAYLEKEEDRGKLWEYLLASQGKVRISGVTIYRIDLDEDLQSATVSVQYNLMRTNEAVLHKVTARQHWYIGSDGHWYLRLDPEELTRLD